MRIFFDFVPDSKQINFKFNLSPEHAQALVQWQNVPAMEELNLESLCSVEAWLPHLSAGPFQDGTRQIPSQTTLVLLGYTVFYRLFESSPIGFYRAPLPGGALGKKILWNELQSTAHSCDSCCCWSQGYKFYSVSSLSTFHSAHPPPPASVFAGLSDLLKDMSQIHILEWSVSSVTVLFSGHGAQPCLFALSWAREHQETHKWLPTFQIYSLCAHCVIEPSANWSSISPTKMATLLPC